jgi:hypothetical protein
MEDQGRAVTTCAQRVACSLVVGLSIYLFGGSARGAEQQRSDNLPGASGPRVVRLAQPPAGMNLLWACVINDDDFLLIGGTPSQEIRDKALPQTMKSGVKKLVFAMDFKESLPGGTSIGIEILSKSGPIKLKEFASTMSARKPSGEFRIQVGRFPEAGTFPDGKYQGVISLNGTAVAQLNWSIGQ